MTSLAFSLLSLLVVSLTATSSTSLKVMVPGRCPDICTQDISTVFNTCIPARSKGCTMSFCQHPSKKPSVQCTLKPGIPSSLKPGETIIFKNAYVDSKHKLNIKFGKSPAKTDIYFLADATGSMTGILASVKKNFLKLAAETDRMGDAAYGVGIFRDERELRNGFRNVQSITKSLATARDALSKFDAKDGLDTPEGNLAALYMLANSPGAIGWRPGARRVVLYIGDNPGHEPTCVKGVKGPIARNRVIAALNKKKIAVIALTFSMPGLNGTPTMLGCAKGTPDGPKGQATAIAKATGGVVIKGYDSKFEVKKVVAAIKKLTKEVSVASNTCMGKVGVAFDRSLPTFLESRTSVVMTVSPKRALCGGGPYSTCQVVFKESGVVLPKVEIKFNFLKCPAPKAT